MPPEGRTYSDADLVELRREWEAQAAQREIVKQVAEINGQLAALPVTMEQVARRVFAELIAEQHRQKAADRSAERTQTWNRAPVVVQVVQLIVAMIAVVAAYLAGKGYIH